MGIIQDTDVGRLLQDKTLMDDVVKALVEDSTAMESLADEIADKLEDALEDDSELRKRIVEAAVANETFKREIVSKLAEELS